MFEYALHEMRRAELLREAGEHRLAREVAAARRAARSRGGRGGEREGRVSARGSGARTGSGSARAARA
ncbi:MULTISPECIES: hypothetical protein [Streptomyces]|uniref:Uncharacterized protein n=1 Tax=Streptomyces lycii TaxID=2654337 RepID=A0ABQ7FH80_9ACTN|nr:hypothetical protein [Streptomyces lycii]KAF4408369.1 hypothetical protein GCU69_14320 [Streptomyces lycii]